MLKLIALIAGTLSLLPTAHADGAGALLLLGVVRNGHFDSHLSTRLSEHLEHIGEPLVKGARISATEHLCADQECMDQVATRENADHVMTLQITAEKFAPPFIRLALLDMQSHRLINKEGICDPCSGDALGLVLESVTDRAFVELRQPPAGPADNPITASIPAPIPAPVSPEASPAAPLSAPESVPVPAPLSRVSSAASALSFGRRTETLPRSRKIGAGILGGVSAIALISSIALAATNGHYTSLPCSTSAASNPSGQCRLDNAIPMGIGFSISIAAAAGGLGLLLWPTERAPQIVPTKTVNAAAQEN